MRIALLLGSAAAVFLAGMWAGEGREAAIIPFLFPFGRFSPSPWLTALLVFGLTLYVALAVFLLRPFRHAGRIAGACLLLLVLPSGILAGDASGSRAYNDCVENAAVVQAGIEQFRQRNGRYPVRLEEVGNVPCRRLLRGTILRYERTASGYELGFRDWLVQWRGSEREPITAWK